MAITGATIMTTESESSPAQHANLGIVAAEIAIFTIATYAASTIVIIICVYIWDRLWGRRRGLVGPPAGRSSEAPGTGMSPSAIAALPTYAYRRVMDGSGSANIGTSAQQTVCMSLVEEGEMCHSSVEAEEVVRKVEFGVEAAPLPPPV
ncbi:RING-H2 finger protein ATL40-like [Cocos nucifera]|uniref:RING-H2 finger protein ATL40-like n=1 Tax=Cocos nucifera TaxID=13894 RepID=A0A8K0I3L7_COCNU|nr:RING-H2 finger protein ATL40-like [Cocos nucifera]KAG1335223.1 RING-H2 finger protein ATL40-like [Cocos nucifera]